jgi:peptidyl-prolyl cis-trans isomerase SurA
MELPRIVIAGLLVAMLSAPAQSQALRPAKAAPKAQAAVMAPLDLPTAPAPAPAAPSAPRAAPDFSAHVAATVNDEVITTYDLRQRMLLLIVTSGVQPNEQNLPELQREALRGLVDERLEMQEIRRIQTKQKMKLEPSDKEVDEELADLARGNNMRLDQLARQLAAADVSINTLREQIRAQSAWRRYIGGRFGSSVRIGEDQIRASLNRINAAAAKPQFQVSEIFLDAQRLGGMQVAQNGARQLMEQIQQGAPFPAVARQFSSAASAASGGDAGWVISGEAQPAVQTALEQMQPGQMAGPVATPDGYYILLLRDKRAGASSTMVNLKQAVIKLGENATPEQVAAATATLTSLSNNSNGCEGFESRANKVSGVVAGETGETDINDLAAEFRTAIEPLKAGQIAAPVRTKQGLHLIALCSKRTGGAHEPSHTEVENRLYGEQLSMLSKRFLRDLRNSATIDAR